MGLLNGVWAATALLSPLLAGLAAEHVGPRTVFAATEAACVVVLSATVVLARRTRHPDQSVPAAVTRHRVGIAAARPQARVRGDDED
jgi:MFS family permease